MKVIYSLILLIFFSLILMAGINVIEINILSAILNKKLFSTINTSVGFVGSVASIVSIFLSSRHYLTKQKIFRRYSIRQSEFINRKKEIGRLLHEINKNVRFINVFGDKGVGKSETLKLLADIVNKRLDRQVRRTFPAEKLFKRVKNISALYFDVSDRTGIDDIGRELCTKTFPNIKPSLVNFIDCIEKANKKRKLLLIIDNVNNHGLRPDIEKTIEIYSRDRIDDIFIIASVDPFYSFKYSFINVEILPFKEKEIICFADVKGVRLSEKELKDIIGFSRGLPIYLEIILNSKFHEKLSEKILLTDIKKYIIDEVLPHLDEKASKILKYASFLNLSLTEVNIGTFNQLGFNKVEDEIMTLRRNSLIVESMYDSNVFKVHDKVAEIITDEFYLISLEINNHIAAYFKRIGRNRSSVLHFLLSNRLLENYEFIINTINHEIEEENFAFLISVGQLAGRFERNNYIVNEIPELYNAILYAYLYATMGIGNYLAAAEIAKNSMIGSHGISGINSIKNRTEFEFYFLMADLDHLQNNYDIAIETFQILLNKAKELSYRDSIPKCLWGIAHSYRHQGKHLVTALEYYEKCEEEAKRENDIKHMIRCINGKVGINLIWNNLNIPYDDYFAEIYNLINSDSTYKNMLYSTYKYHSIYLRKIKKYDEAKHYITESLNGFRRIGKRLIYNLYFEFGEYFRDIENYAEAIRYYKMSLEFSEKNMDRNLITHSKIGIILSEIGANNYLHHKGKSDQINTLLKVIETSEDADIFINKIQAQIVLDYLKEKKSFDSPGSAEYLESQRLTQEANLSRNLNPEVLKHMHLILL